MAKKLTKKADSKEPIRAFTTSKWSATVVPDFNFDTALNMLDADPVSSGAIQHYVDKSIEGNWSIIKRDSGKYDKAFEDKLRYDFNFDNRVLRKIFYVGKLFNNVFLEIVKYSDGSLKDTNVLDSTNIEPITKPNGDVIEFKSKIPNPKTGKYARWSKDEIIWFKFQDRDGGYSHVNVMSLWNTLLMKNYIQRFVTWLWQTGQYRVVHNFKASDGKVVEDFVAYNRKNEGDFRQPFLTQGDYGHSILRDMKETESLVELLKYLDGQILILLRVPPIDAGIPDASGRSNSDAQTNNLNTHIKSRKKVVKAGIDRMFKIVNHGNNAIVFSPVDKFEIKGVLENVQLMKSAGFTDKVCIEYMRDNGMVWEDSKVFNEPEETDSSIKNPRDKDNMPSRVGKGVGEGNESIGTGSEATTREDQLVKKSFSDVYDYSEQWREY
jgi:hypothetical protein